MPRKTDPPKLRSHADCLALVTEIVETAAAHESACEALRREIGEYIEGHARLPADWLGDSEPARRAIAGQVMHRLEADGHGLLKEWRDRILQGRDHATFWTMIYTVVLYVAIGYAQSADRERDVTPRVRRRRRRQGPDRERGSGVRRVADGPDASAVCRPSRMGVEKHHDQEVDQQDGEDGGG